jgi:enoyl-CoA hydratase/carnithine racemase
MESPSLIEYSIDAGIAVVTLNRPEKRNALSDAMRTEFIAALERASGDQAVRAVVVTGKGKSFCSGGDIQGMQQRLRSPAGEIAFNGWSRQKRTHHAVSLLHFMAKPTIAAVNGSSAGLGTDLALCCDFILASEEASFAWSYIHRGLVPDGGGLYFLPRRVGLSRAKELIFSGRRVDAHEALQLGIADRVSTPAALLDDAIAWAKELSGGSPTALALGKAILDASFESDAHEVFAQGSQAQSICYTTSEHHQAVADFLAKSARKA